MPNINSASSQGYASGAGVEPGTGVVVDVAAVSPIHVDFSSPFTRKHGSPSP